MQAALSLIEDLLRQYGQFHQANLAMIAREQFVPEPQEACRFMNDEAWPGGTDIIAAVDLALCGGFVPAVRRHGQKLREALIEIYATMNL